MNSNNIIIRPVISEKSMGHVEKGKFTFIVFRAAKKPQIKKAIEEQYGVHVIGISTAITKGRSTKAGKKRLEVRYQPIKKAIIALKKGEKIDVFDIGA